jgi:hypothetical protein
MAQGVVLSSAIDDENGIKFILLRLFGEYPGAPRGEPTPQEDEAITAAIHRHRAAGMLRRLHLRTFGEFWAMPIETREAT